MEKALKARAGERQRAIRLAKRYARLLARRLGPLMAFVIGSYARGDFNDASDIDVIIVSDALPTRPLERMEVLYSCVLPGIEPRGYTSTEFSRLLKRGDPGAIEAIERGYIVAYV